MPPAVERSNAIRAKSIEADTLRVGGQSVTPMAWDCGTVEVRGEAEVRPKLGLVANVQVSLAARPPVPGLLVSAEFDNHAGTITLRAWKPSGNGLQVVPAVEPAPVHWVAFGV